MRLFRQSVPGNWDAVLQRVADELAEKTGQEKIVVPADPAAPAIPDLDLRAAHDVAMADLAAGRHDASEAIAREMLAVRPNDARALHLIGIIQLSRGQQAEAVEKNSPP